MSVLDSLRSDVSGLVAKQDYEQAIDRVRQSQDDTINKLVRICLLWMAYPNTMTEEPNVLGDLTRRIECSIDQAQDKERAHKIFEALKQEIEEKKLNAMSDLFSSSEDSTLSMERPLAQEWPPESYSSLEGSSLEPDRPLAQSWSMDISLESS